MATTKKASAMEAITTIDAEAKIEAAPAYDRDNLNHVLKRLRAVITEVKAISADLAGHHRKCSRTHHVNGGAPGSTMDDPVAHDPAMAARLHALQSAIGEFTHIVGANTHESA